LRGTVYIIYPDKPREIREYLGPIPDNTLSEIVGGLYEPIILWDHFTPEDGTSVRCVAVANQEGFGLPQNIWATAYWHYLIRAKGEKRQPVNLYGPVAVIYGDEEFMEVAL
jgi:hypothetical protein